MDKKILQIINAALKEDNVKSDITSRLLINRDNRSTAFIVVKENAVVCGLNIARTVFKKIDPKLTFTAKFKDGSKVRKGTAVAVISGKTRSILTGERTALNFLGHLSGIATNTRSYVDRIKPYKAKILDTRKTTPTLRSLQKYAVKNGGGINHRMDLNDQILVKDNHLLALSKSTPLTDVIKKIKKRSKKTLIIEVDTLKQLEDTLSANPDIILLDNMKPGQLRKAVKLVQLRKAKKHVLLEASGGITKKNIRRVAQTGVNRISIGELTHSVKNIDFGLNLKT